MKLFSKNLTPTDCLKRLSIPKGVLPFLPEFHGGHAAELLVRYENIEWRLVCTVRKKGRYKKPVLSKGWRKFVLGNRLNVGDQLTLYKEEDDSSSLHYRLELKRATILSRTPSQPPRAPDPEVDETISIYQTSTAITSGSVGSVRGADRTTDESNNALFKQFNSHISDVVDVNNQEISKSKNRKQQERELKQLGAIETIDHHKACHNSLKQFGLSTGGAELVDTKGQARLRSDGTTKETTAAAAVLEHFNLGLTERSTAALVHVHDHDQDQASCSTSLYKTDQWVGLELDTILGQSTHGSIVNLDLTLGYNY